MGDMFLHCFIVKSISSMSCWGEIFCFILIPDLLFWYTMSSLELMAVILVVWGCKIFLILGILVSASLTALAFII